MDGRKEGRKDADFIVLELQTSYVAGCAEGRLEEPARRRTTEFLGGKGKGRPEIGRSTNSRQEKSAKNTYRVTCSCYSTYAYALLPPYVQESHLAHDNYAV